MDNNKQIVFFLIDYIEDHISDEISLDEMADAAGYSKYHLHRMFTGIVGLPLHQYIKRRQLTQAAKSLIFLRNRSFKLPWMPDMSRSRPLCLHLNACIS